MEFVIPLNNMESHAKWIRWPILFPIGNVNFRNATDIQFCNDLNCGLRLRTPDMCTYLHPLGPHVCITALPNSCCIRDTIVYLLAFNQRRSLGIPNAQNAHMNCGLVHLFLSILAYWNQLMCTIYLMSNIQHCDNWSILKTHSYCCTLNFVLFNRLKSMYDQIRIDKEYTLFG